MQARCRRIFRRRMSRRPPVMSTALAPFRLAFNAGKMLKSSAISGRWKSSAAVGHHESRKKYHSSEGGKHGNRRPQGENGCRMRLREQYKLQRIKAVGERIDFHEPPDPS